MGHGCTSHLGPTGPEGDLAILDSLLPSVREKRLDISPEGKHCFLPQCCVTVPGCMIGKLDRDR
uniref:Uncharacterized protein n=1 Tax=Anopheles minimus TaxID=112268 RepID=A0A182WQB6_9DIPT